MARISTSIWDDPEWRALTSQAQLLGIACMVIGATGACTTTRITAKTGWTSEFVEMHRAELEASAYANVLTGTVKRRRLPRALVREVFTRDEFMCLSCGAEDNLSIDHIHPVARGGSDDLDNLQTLCLPCNLRKGARVA